MCRSDVADCLALWPSPKGQLGRLKDGAAKVNMLAYVVIGSQVRAGVWTKSFRSLAPFGKTRAEGRGKKRGMYDVRRGVRRHLSMKSGREQVECRHEARGTRRVGWVGQQRELEKVALRL